MSVKYNNNDVVGVLNNIDDANVSDSTMYSSKKIDDTYRYFDNQYYVLQNSTRGVKDMVGSYAELINYDVNTLLPNDILGVISDETHGFSHSYYRWVSGHDFIYIGDVGTSYTQTEFNTKIDEKEFKLVNGVNIKTINGEDLLGQGNLDIKADLNTYYPIGYIWQTVSLTNPADIFGGTWEKLHDVSLFSSNDNHPVGETGGERKHLLTVDELARHTHNVRSHDHTGTFSSALSYSSMTSRIVGTGNMGIPMARSVTSTYSDGMYDDIKLWRGAFYKWYYDVDWDVINNGSYIQYGTINLKSATINMQPMPDIEVQPHENLPQVYIVHMWKRIA